ncbi:MAG: enoyl-CoA hydratase/isomerase family protein [Gammaproteobacteria bacterium]|nr:enoyl-CoA hydratase/isomerase family protein [Gammaproteobacteria bacterium]
MKHGKVTLEVTQGVGLLTLNDPSTLNSFGQLLREDFADAVDQIDSDPAIRALVITGAGRGFSSGANLNDKDAPPRDRAAEERGEHKTSLEAYYNPMLERFSKLSLPMVSAVNGVAAGVGMSFALSCDLVVAARSAYFLQAFARIGLVPDGGSTYILPRLVGMRRALEMSLLAERIPAEQALEWGLISRVVDDDKLMEEAVALATRLANGPRSLGLIRQLYWRSLQSDYPTQLQAESDFQKTAGATQDHDEGVTAFREKRAAKFVGR